MEEALKKAFRAGFDASGEGYNGEYPFRDHGQSPETDKDWVAQRDKEVLEILAEQPAQRKPLTEPQKQALAENWFAEDWAITKAIGMMIDHERLLGIKEKA